MTTVPWGWKSSEKRQSLTPFCQLRSHIEHRQYKAKGSPDRQTIGLSAKFSIGRGMNMRKSTIRAEVPCDVETVWSVVTDNGNFAWRSDLCRVEVVDEKRFVEYTPQGIATRFTITRVKPYERYEFDLENENLAGHWTGIFTRIPTGTRVELIEEVTFKKGWVRVVSALAGSLQRMQKAYVRDLQKALSDARKSH